MFLTFECVKFIVSREGVKANCKYLSDYLQGVQQNMFHFCFLNFSASYWSRNFICSVTNFLSISPYPPLVFSHNFPVLFSAPPLVSFSVPPPCVFFHLPPPPGEFLCPSHLCIFPVNKLLFAESVLANKLFQILNKIV